jgi:hypothetical protein
VLGFFLLAVINVVLAVTAPLLNKSKMSSILRIKPSPVAPRADNYAISKVVNEAVEALQDRFGI